MHSADGHHLKHVHVGKVSVLNIWTRVQHLTGFKCKAIMMIISNFYSSPCIKIHFSLKYIFSWHFTHQLHLTITWISGCMGDLGVWGVIIGWISISSLFYKAKLHQQAIWSGVVSQCKLISLLGLKAWNTYFPKITWYPCIKYSLFSFLLSRLKLGLTDPSSGMMMWR